MEGLWIIAGAACHASLSNGVMKQEPVITGQDLSPLKRAYIALICRAIWARSWHIPRAIMFNTMYSVTVLPSLHHVPELHGHAISSL